MKGSELIVRSLGLNLSNDPIRRYLSSLKIPTLKVISEAPPGILEGTISFPKVNLGSAKKISWASARLQKLLSKSGGWRPFWFVAN